MKTFLLGLSLLLAVLNAQAETIRIAIGTQDSTINTAAGGLLIRELNLLEKYLPRDGKYQDVQYRIIWKNFTSGAPLTNEMVAGKLDFASMAEFPGLLNIAAHQRAGKRSVFINVLSGSVDGSGNGIVVPASSDVQSLAELKGKTISVPFASTAHGMLLRAIDAQGWDVQRDVRIISQAPEVAGPALQTGKIDAHADFVPFAELFPWRGFARKIYDGYQSATPTFHGTLVDTAYAERYPEVVIGVLRAVIEANQLLADAPEKYSKLIARVTGVEAEVNYLFHGPSGLQTRDLSFKPEYRKALEIGYNSLRLLGRAEEELDLSQAIDERYLKAAFAAEGLDYQVALANYDQAPLPLDTDFNGKPLTDLSQVAQLWVQGEDNVRYYASIVDAFAARAQMLSEGKDIHAFYVQDTHSGIKLFAHQAWYLHHDDGLSAYLLREQAADPKNSGQVLDFAQVSQH